MHYTDLLSIIQPFAFRPVIKSLLFALVVMFTPLCVKAAIVPLDLTVNTSEVVIVDTAGGTPSIAIDVGGVSRTATYSSGSGSAALVFSYTPVVGDVDLDGIAVFSPIALNGGTIRDASGNNAIVTFIPPNTTNVKIDYPSLSMDFIADADGRYTLNGTAYNDLPAFLTATGGTFSRNSIGTYYDASGALQTATANTPRFDFDPITLQPKGILIEESRTNSIRNSSAVGAVVGSPGTMPTNWSSAVILANGLSAEVIAKNSYGALNTVDLRIFGTPTNTTPALYFDSQTQITASSGQTWVLSGYTQITGGSTAGISSINLRMVERNSGGGIVIVQDSPISIPTSGPISAQRFSASRLLTGGTTAYLHPGILIATSVGIPVDITLRIGGLQLEQGAAPTSYIPTTTVGVTRAADIFAVPTSSWSNINESSIILSAEATSLPATSGTFQIGFGTNSSNYIGFPYITSTGFASQAYYRSAGVGPLINGSPSLSLNLPYRAGYSYSTTSGTSSYSKNGILSGTGSGVNIMASASTLYIGASPFNSLVPATGHIRNSKYYPTRIIDSQINLLTQ